MAAAHDLAWRVHPLRRFPARTAALIAFAAVLWPVATRLGGLWALVLVAAFTVVPAAGFIWPTAYRVGPGGVALDNPFAHEMRPWSAFAGYRADRDAVRLLFVPATWRARRLGGVTLVFGGNRDQVMAAVAGRLPSLEPAAPRRR